LEVAVSFIHRPASLLGSAAVAGLLVVGLGACSDEPERDESGEVTEGGEESVFDIAVGDCLNSQSAAGTVSELPVVPCTEAHDSEVFHIYNVPGDTFPGDFTQMRDEQCMPAFQTFVGLPYDQSVIEVTTLEPTAETWADGDRELVCIAVDPAGNVTGSLQGANR
jgi:hypothetical protein